MKAVMGLLIIIGGFAYMMYKLFGKKRKEQ